LILLGNNKQQPSKMAVQSKLDQAKLLSTMLWIMIKPNLNYKGAIMAAGVAIGTVGFLRGMRRDRQSSTAATTEQLLLMQAEEDKKKAISNQRKNAQPFSARFKRIVEIIIPSWNSKEFCFVAVLSGLLIARTIFSVVIAEMIGQNVMALVSKNWIGALQGVITFSLLSFPASFINSYIKHISSLLALMFRVRLSEYVNKQYVKGVNFYAACSLHGINDVDQRVTTDIKQFCEEIASLYSSIFKPILDIILFTNQLRMVTGW